MVKLDVVDAQPLVTSAVVLLFLETKGSVAFIGVLNIHDFILHKLKPEHKKQVGGA